MALLYPAGYQFLDSNGDPLPGAKLHVYQNGTTTAQTIYTDAALSTVSVNPVILDIAGRTPTNIYLTDGTSVTVDLDTSADADVFSRDEVFGWAALSNLSVMTLAALKALSSMADGDVVTLLGYHTAHDNGGGVYAYDADSTESANNGTVVLPDSGVGRWLLKSSVVSAKNFGAKGDGTTDDTAEIQAAIDYLEGLGGGELIVPRGIYIVSDTLTVDNVAVRLRGDAQPVVEQMFQTTVSPQGSVIKLADGAFDSSSDAIIEFIYQGTGGEARLGGGLRDLVIFGNRSTDTASADNGGSYNNNNTYGIGVLVTGARYVTCENVFSLWCAEDGFKTATGGSQSVGANNNAFYRCVAVANGDDGFDISGGDSHGAMLQSGANGGDGYAFAAGKAFNGLLGWNNEGNGCRISGGDIRVDGTFYDNDGNGVLVSGDLDRVSLDVICQDNGVDTGLTNDQRAGILVSGTSNVFVNGISGNKDGVTQTYGLRVTQSDAIVKHNLIEGGVANTVEFISDLSAFEEKTIATGAITVTKETHAVDTEADASSDDLDTINGGYQGSLLTLRAANSTRTVVVKDGTGNIASNGDFSLDNTEDMILLQKVGSSWQEISRSDNGA